MPPRAKGKSSGKQSKPAPRDTSVILLLMTHEPTPPTERSQLRFQPPDTSEAMTHFHFLPRWFPRRGAKAQFGRKTMRRFQVPRTIYRSGAAWTARSCRCPPRPRRPCRRAAGPPPAGRRPPASAWKRGAPSGPAAPSVALAGRPHLTHRWPHRRVNRGEVEELLSFSYFFFFQLLTYL